MSKETTNLTVRAYLQIRGQILASRLRPGEKINISDICSRMEFSLGTVREALARLTSEELVQLEPNKGFRVAPVTIAELTDLTETRILIECECLMRSIARGDLSWEAEIVSTLFTLSKTALKDPADVGQINLKWTDIHRHFHRALASRCGSPWLLKLRETLYDQSERYRSLSVPLDPTDRDLVVEHQKIADAAIDRDENRACELMRDHLRRTTQILLKSGIAAD